MALTRLNIVTLLLFAGFLSQAQDKSVFLELGGYGGIYSFNYEKPITIKETPLKLRMGIGGFPLDENSGTLIIFPLGLNYELGDGIHRLDLGVGHTVTTSTLPSIHSQSNLSIGYLHKTDEKFWYRVSYTPLISHWVDFQYQHWVGVSLGLKLNNK